MFEFGSELSIRKQAEILNFTRSRLYYRSVLSDDSVVANLIRDVYLSSDCRYGYRKIAAALKNQGDVINRKKVLRIMRGMGIEGLYPKRKIKTSVADKEHKIYPYLLNDLKIEKANQVWATDLTYIKIDTYFMYFIAIIDLYSRYIVSNSRLLFICLNILIFFAVFS